MHKRPRTDVTYAVRARGVTKSFGDVLALETIDLDVERGEIHGLVGPNGAGKTTLLGLLLGLASPDAGSLEILGTQVGRAPSVHEGVAGFVEGPGLYPSLTARKNLATLAVLRGIEPRTRVAEVLHEVGLTEVADEPVQGFSLGMRQRLGLASALLGRPRLLVLDEASNGLDPAGKRQAHAVLTELARTGTSIILSSHRMDDVESLCSEVTILDTGRVVFSGPPATLAAEVPALDYRLVLTDARAGRRVAARLPAIHLVEGSEPSDAAGAALVVRAAAPALDELVVGLVHAGVAIRELCPLVSPLEAAFLALTDRQEHAR
ncbi:ABC transporter ATP-binding protein [Terrabacter lapilli]|uniref:ABC transporter ATP-binding protein n=1 Tax=Terrabacter lapilli TaxID=436231 RepID=UPI0031DA0ABE